MNGINKGVSFFTGARVNLRHMAVCLPLFLAAPAEVWADGDAADQRQSAAKSMVYRVDNVQVNILESYPPMLEIRAEGMVPTAGWNNAELVAFQYIQAPPDGVYDFGFVAMPPDQPAAEVISSMSVTYRMAVIPDGLKGVRVHAESNSKAAMLGETDVSQSKKVCLKGRLTEEGVECPAFRDTQGRLYTLGGDLSGYRPGDEVYVTGEAAEYSFCMQGVTISVDYIGASAPNCYDVTQQQNAD
ncbi:DUF5818 domain-containing protein [Hahella aquimaris]|uniref:DUF5818 domain-containing protein n=1 Tax=Hahella sp. HNIBRBA332 TaxID=3015983 RepID=UPI00273ACC4B|nr:DUF5818 domain-containing protein [Hahella sp. HNIBRBA332]WLQ15122.1 DUF5818 domain-containing protein [Hahella sp. HNIBRBA332]